jgi:hypothetical protein
MQEIHHKINKNHEHVTIYLAVSSMSLMHPLFTSITIFITFAITLLVTTYTSIFHDSLQSRVHFDLSSQHICLSSSTFLLFVRFSYSDSLMLCFNSTNVKCYSYELMLKTLSSLLCAHRFPFLECKENI